MTSGLQPRVTPAVPSCRCVVDGELVFVEEGVAQRNLDGRPAGRVVSVIPLLVEYSEDDDTGCAFGAAVMVGVIVGGWLLLRLATTHNRR